MIFARNRIAVPDTYNGNSVYYPEQFVGKLRLWVEVNDVIMQVSEDDVNQPPAFSNPLDTEILCPTGFYSFIPLTMWSAFRFKNNAAGQAGRISFVGYA